MNEKKKKLPLIKHVLSQRKRKRKSNLDHVCFPKFTFRETTSQTFMCLFAIRKVVNRKHFPVK